MRGGGWALIFSMLILPPTSIHPSIHLITTNPCLSHAGLTMAGRSRGWGWVAVTRGLLQDVGGDDDDDDDDDEGIVRHQSAVVGIVYSCIHVSRLASGG